MARQRTCESCGRAFTIASGQQQCPTCQPRSSSAPRSKPASGYVRRGGRPWRRIRAEALERDHHVCHWCGGPATEGDHLVPIDDGGQELDLDNVVASCTRCNRRRGASAKHPTVAVPALPGAFTVGRGLVVLIGPPAAGKTTWARAIAPDIVCSPDDFGPAGPWTSSAYRAAETAAVGCARDLLHAGRGAILDSTGSSRRQRDRYRATARAAGRPVTGVIVLPALNVTLRRAAARERSTSADVVIRIDKQIRQDLPSIVMEPWNSIFLLDPGGDDERSQRVPARRVGRTAPRLAAQPLAAPRLA